MGQVIRSKHWDRKPDTSESIAAELVNQISLNRVLMEDYDAAMVLVEKLEKEVRDLKAKLAKEVRA